MNESLSSRPVAIVTGARRGIGRAIAWELAERGFDLVLNDIVDDEAFQVTREGLNARGARHALALGDIALDETHAALVTAARGEFRRIDCLVNNAGIQVSRRADIMEVGRPGFERLLRVNLMGTFFLTQAVARQMLAEPAREGRTLITLSSANAAMASVEKAEYCIAKTGLSMMNRLFALRLAESGIACHEIQPGLIATDMTAPVHEAYGARIEAGLSPVRRWGQPEDVARAVSALALGALPFTTGHAFQIDGGLQLARL